MEWKCSADIKIPFSLAVEIRIPHSTEVERWNQSWKSIQLFRALQSTKEQKRTRNDTCAVENLDLRDFFSNEARPLSNLKWKLGSVEM
jgi:hypothetical protein